MARLPTNPAGKRVPRKLSLQPTRSSPRFLAEENLQRDFASTLSACPENLERISLAVQADECPENVSLAPPSNVCPGNDIRVPTKSCKDIAAMSNNHLEAPTGDLAHLGAAGTPAVDVTPTLGAQAHGDAHLQNPEATHHQPPQGNMNQPAAANADVIQLLLQALQGIQQQPAQPTQITMAQCTNTYNGERDHATVRAFTTNIELFREVSRIPENQALKGLPLLLKGEAQLWWDGISHSVHSWRDALDQIHAAFAPRHSNSEIYAMIFSTHQGNKSTEVFIAEKRAILARLSDVTTEQQQLDMLYWMLRHRIRRAIPRGSILNFADLVQRARHEEKLEQEEIDYQKTTPATGKGTNSTLRPAAETSEHRDSTKSTKKRDANSSEARTSDAQPANRKPVTRCEFCKYRGHTKDECNKL